MVFGVKRKKNAEQRELMRVARRKEKPTPTQVCKLGVRRAFGVPSKVHKKGNLVTVNGKLARVTKSSRKGVTVERFRKDKKSGLATPSGKTQFVPEKRVIGGAVQPFFPTIAP